MRTEVSPAINDAAIIAWGAVLREFYHAQSDAISGSGVRHARHDVVGDLVEAVGVLKGRAAVWHSFEPALDLTHSRGIALADIG
jgi:hypothetical protein